MKYLSIIIIIVFGSCSANYSQPSVIIKQLPAHKSKMLKRILQDTTIHQLNLDKGPVDTISLIKHNLMGVPSSSSSPVLGKAVGMVTVKDHFWIADRAWHGILVMDKKGKLYQKMGRQGSGPGEYRFITAISRNQNYIFISDLKKAKVQVFKPNYTFVTSLTGNILSARFTATANDKMLFMAASVKDSANLIQVRQAYPPWKKESTFFPQLIPLGYQPAAYNDYLISTNNRGQTVVCYPSLPYLFFYNQKLEHTNTIFLKTKRYEALGNPPIIPKPHLKIVKVSWLFESLNFQENGDIYFRMKNTIFRLKWDGNRYKLANKFVASYQKHPVYVRQVLERSNDLYLISLTDKYIYKLRLSAL